MFINKGPIYTIEDFDNIFFGEYKIRKAKKGKEWKEYINLPAAFDIETTSFYEEAEKRACMYVWAFGVNGVVFTGRTWKEYIELTEKIKERFELCESRRLIVYVHNLSFDFQFFRGWFSFNNVFALDERKVCYALDNGGIEYRCSYILTNKSLEAVGKDLTKYPVQKLKGDLDYSLCRNSKTELTKKEWSYIENDVRVVMSLIQEKIEEEGDNITRIPLTNTGYVRKYCRKICLNKENGPKYRRIMNALKIDKEEYKQLKRAFQGGYTHASAQYSGETLSNVTSYDFTSSYPAVMIAEQFPMSKGIRIPDNEAANNFTKYLRLYCCLFNVKFTNIRQKYEIPDNYIAKAKCYNLIGYRADNGRINEAKELTTTITEQDFEIIKRLYDWDEMKINNLIVYKKDYLPTAFVSCILDFYSDKTTLKGVEGREQEYNLKKGMLNSCYGMTVTDPCRDEIIYGDTWESAPANIDECLDKYNNSRGRFLFYPWGVWVTAYARRNLFTGIISCGDDYVYSDTDSIKILNAGCHKEYIDIYNNWITEKMKKALKYHGFKSDISTPETIKGEKKPIGVWDFDGFYTRFKTLGAKRYITEKEGTINITVAGLSKETAVPYLLEHYGDVFGAFSDELDIPPEGTGKSTHSYGDFEIKGKLIDFRGKAAEYNERGFVHLEGTGYSLSISEEYKKYLFGINDLYI